jgi:hypothetical protein
MGSVEDPAGVGPHRESREGDRVEIYTSTVDTPSVAYRQGGMPLTYPSDASS